LIAYPASVARLDRLGEFLKRGADTNAGRMIDDEFVVSAPQVLHERVAGGDRAGRADLFESAHWTEPVFEAAMIGFDDVVAYRSTMCRAPGRSLSMTRGYTAARSVVTSTGARP
jgi:hypothetical protein